MIEDVGINETRCGFVRTLQEMGAGIEIVPTGMEGNEPVGRIVVESGHQLRGIEFGGASLIQSMIDELPMLAALAARADGRTVIRDAQELKDKDTDRIATTVAALRPFGVKIERAEDGFVIEPSDLSGAKSLLLPPDHRVIFAAMTLASSLEEPTTMSGWEKVSVSFPGCLDLLGQLASVSHLKRCEAGGTGAMEAVKTIIITGGGGHLGRCVARWWASPHCTSCAHRSGRRTGSIRSRADLARAWGRDQSVIATDATKPDEIEANAAASLPGAFWASAAVARLAHGFGQGRRSAKRPRLGELDHQRWQEVLDVNLTSVVFTIQMHFCPS